MEIQVTLFNQLRCYGPGGHSVFSIHLSSGSAAGNLLQFLNIPSTVQRTILINGRRVDETALLSPGDEVVMMSLIEGG